MDETTSEKVVCFTEMPLQEVKSMLPVLRENDYTRFSSYGIGFCKKYVFRKKGLPVIYQPRKFLDELPDSLKWRHVNLFMAEEFGVDFTWQREWRINARTSNTKITAGRMLPVSYESVNAPG